MTYAQAVTIGAFVAFAIIAIVSFVHYSNVMGAILFALIAVGGA